jgi:hypothetical protein
MSPDKKPANIDRILFILKLISLPPKS